MQKYEIHEEKISAFYLAFNLVTKKAFKKLNSPSMVFLLTENVLTENYLFPIRIFPCVCTLAVSNAGGFGKFLVMFFTGIV